MPCILSEVLRKLLYRTYISLSKVIGTLYLPCIVKFFETILKQFFTFIYIHESIPLPQAIKLIKHALEELYQLLIDEHLEGIYTPKQYSCG